jgi:hypothetical protein
VVVGGVVVGGVVVGTETGGDGGEGVGEVVEVVEETGEDALETGELVSSLGQLRSTGVVDDGEALGLFEHSRETPIKAAVIAQRTMV